jgi:hypothetical protein
MWNGMKRDMDSIQERRKNMKKYMGLVLAVILTFAIGCAPTIEGKKFDAEKRNQVFKGATTSSEVIGLLGQPFKVEKLSSGGEKYIYYYYTEELAHWWDFFYYDKETLEVTIKDGIVENYVYTQENRGKPKK